MIWWTVPAAFLLAVIASEVVLGGTKLQTGLARILAVHSLLAAVLLAYLFLNSPGALVAAVIFWAGAFLAWFVVRSHAESSILLRMIFLLRSKPRTRDQLIAEYSAAYGGSLRLEELLRGGLARQGATGIEVTAKGRNILRIVSLLK